MKKVEINIWDKYWRWTILDDLWSRLSWWKKRRFVKCKCDCWNIQENTLDKLRMWESKSCWCLQKEVTSSNIIHWMSRRWKMDKFYITYYNILKRCNDKNSRDYHNYWWRWIKCEWNSFEDFKNDMYESYLEHKSNNKETTIDRIDVNGNYSKENCKWSTNYEQQRNTRRTIKIDWLCAKDYCKLHNLSYTYFLKKRKWQI